MHFLNAAVWWWSGYDLEQYYFNYIKWNLWSFNGKLTAKGHILDVLEHVVLLISTIHKNIVPKYIR